MDLQGKDVEFPSEMRTGALRSAVQREKALAEAQYQAQYLNQTSAPKPWVECGIEEKLERMRQQVKGDQRELERAHQRIERLRQDSSKLRMILEMHQHQPIGGILVPAHCIDQAKERLNPQCDQVPAVQPELAYF